MTMTINRIMIDLKCSIRNNTYDGIEDQNIDSDDCNDRNHYHDDDNNDLDNDYSDQRLLLITGIMIVKIVIFDFVIINRNNDDTLPFPFECFSPTSLPGLSAFSN